MKKQSLMLMALIGFLGCTKAPALKVYSLEVPYVSAALHSIYRTKSIKIAYPKSLIEVINQKMNFSYAYNDRGTYQNSEWSNDVSILLQGTLIEILDKSKLFQVVLLETSSVHEDYRLESGIFAFRHNVNGQISQALVSIQFNLIDTSTGRLVKSKRFSYAEPTKTINAEGYADATNKALNHLSQDVIKWLQ